MEEDVIFRYKNGRIIPIKIHKDKTTNDVMNDKIRNIKDYDEDEETFKKENSNLLYENNVHTEEQELAISDYTSDYGYGSSEMINKVLNNEKEVSSDVRTFVNQNAVYIDSCIQQTTNNDMYVYRKINISGDELQVGSEIKNNGFTSASIYKSDGASMIMAGSGTIIKIKVKKGTKALYIGDKTSFARNEREILFGRGHSVKITQVEKVFDKDGMFTNYDVVGELI